MTHPTIFMGIPLPWTVVNALIAGLPRKIPDMHAAAIPQLEFHPWAAANIVRRPRAATNVKSGGFRVNQLLH